MTGSRHDYAAVIVGTPDVPIPVDGGSLTLDEGSAPHVTGRIDVGIPVPAILNGLDPRDKPRIRVTASATFSAGTQGPRTFDLCLRSRPIPHALTGGVVLDLASDEALLDDWRSLIDDTGAFAHQASLRGVVNYALDKAIPGATLAAGPDADVTTYADATNLITDPSNEGTGAIFTAGNCVLDKNDTSWAANGTKSINLYSPSNNDSYLQVDGGPGGLRAGMLAGREYVFSATGRVKAAVGGTANARARRLVVFWKRPTDANYSEAQSTQIAAAVGAVTRVAVRFTIPSDATEAFVRAYHGYTGGEVQWDAFRLTEWTGDPTDTAFFSGATADTAGYDYSWSGAANASTSVRRALIERAPASLLWPAGRSAMEFLHPIVQAAGFRLVCDETRTWTLRDENYNAGGETLTVIEGINLVEGTDLITLDDGLWFDAQVTEYTDPLTNERWVDAFALNDPPARVNFIQVRAAYPGPGRSEYAVRRAQGRGREVTATLVADWRTKAEQTAQIILEGAPLQVGETSRVTFDLETDEMTITTRTTDIPAGAIDLLSGTIDSLVGTIDSL